MRIVGDVLIAGENSIVQVLISSIKERYKRGIVVNHLAAFLFFGSHIVQDSDMNVTTHGDTKFNAINCFPIDRHRRKTLNEGFNAIELRSLRSVNSSVSCLGSYASPFCGWHLQPWLKI